VWPWRTPRAAAHAEIVDMHEQLADEEGEQREDDEQPQGCTYPTRRPLR
jgi:hypothetical protein